MEWGEEFIPKGQAEAIARDALRRRPSQDWQRETMELVVPSPDNEKPGGEFRFQIYLRNDRATVNAQLRGAEPSGFNLSGSSRCSLPVDEEGAVSSLAACLRRASKNPITTARYRYDRYLRQEAERREQEEAEA